MNITIITQNLCVGGVQKGVLALAKALKTKHKVSFLLFEQKELFYDIDDTYDIHYLPHFEVDISRQGIGYEIFESRVLAMKAFFESDGSDLYIVFEDYNALVALEANIFGKKIIVSSCVGFEIYKNRNVHLLPHEFYINSIAKLYPMAGGVIAVSDGVKNDLMKLGVKAYTIHNGIDIELATRLSDEPCEYEDFILHIGRMDFAQKGQDDTLRAFAKIHTKINSNLIFVGDGKDFERLNKMIDEFGIRERVFLVGADKNPYRFLKKCRLLVLSSYYEGMPNVLLEAMALGVAIVSYDFLPSASEFLCNMEPFLLVERGNIDELSSSIFELLSNKMRADNIKRDAIRVAELFRQEQNTNKWLDYIENIVVNR